MNEDKKIVVSSTEVYPVEAKDSTERATADLQEDDPDDTKASLVLKSGKPLNKKAKQ